MLGFFFVVVPEQLSSCCSDTEVFDVFGINPLMVT